MDTKSEYLLLFVDPDLAKVIRKAAQKPQPFRVLQGKRSEKEHQKNLKSGASKAKVSRHTGGKDGLADAVDLVALTDGKIDWAEGREDQVYGAIYRQVKTAADELNIPIEWGGHWKTFKDYVHFQLPWTINREKEDEPVDTKVN